jgi:hypothetical protein
MGLRHRTVLSCAQRGVAMAGDRSLKAGQQRRSYLLRVLFLVIAFTLPCGNAFAQDLSHQLEAPVNPHSALPCPKPEQYSPTRPDPPGTPTVVGLGVFFQDIWNLSDIDQTLNADVYVVSRWRDPRVADPLRGNGSAECPYPGKQLQLWMPAIEAENLRSHQRMYPPLFFVDAKGTVTVADRLLVRVAYPLDFRDFPMDQHRWKITLWPTFSRTDEVVFLPLRRIIKRSDSLSIQGWRVGQPAAEVSASHRPGHMGTYSRFDVVLKLQRNWGYYAWKFGVPLTLIVLMAYCVYFLPSSAVAQQIGVGMTAILTLIAFMLAMGSTLPKIAYLTRADDFFVGSAILVFLGFLKGILTAVWLKHGKEELIDRVNVLGRWLYPVGMLANFVVTIVL